MAERFSSFYRFTDDQTILDANTFNTIFRDIDARLAALESSDGGIDSILSSLRDRGVQQVNDAIQPIIDSLDDLGANELALAQTSLANVQTIESDIQQLYNDIQVGNFGSINVTGAITATGNISTSGNIFTTGSGSIQSSTSLTAAGNVTGVNLSGVNTGGESTASGAGFGIVKFESGGANTGLTFSQDYILGLYNFNNNLVVENQGDISGFSQQVAALITLINSLTARVDELESGTPAPPPGTDVMLIAKSTPDYRDTVIRDELIADGKTVTVVNEASNSLDTQAANYDLVVVAGDAAGYGSTHLNELTNVAVPMVVIDLQAVDNLGLADTPIFINSSSITIANTHPIVSPYSGTVTITSDIFSSSAKWKTGTGAFDIAPDGAKSLLFTYETGANIKTGQAAPARRVAWGVFHAPLNANGLDIFIRSCQWALGEI